MQIKKSLQPLRSSFFLLFIFLFFLNSAHATLPPLTSSTNAGYTNTKYPVILSHGFADAGNSSTEPLTDGWYGITSGLARDGAIVFEPDTSSFNSSLVRGEQLRKFLLVLQAKHGYEKFNLIGHSQGGLDIRYVASVQPDIVASVTVVNSPTFGSGFADSLINLGELHPIVQSVVPAIIALGFDIAGFFTDSEDPQNGSGVVATLTSEGARNFSKEHPQGVPKKWCRNGKRKVNGIRYYSLSGTSVFTNFWDPMDYVLTVTGGTFSGEHDGLVERCASHLGKVLKDNYAWNHLDAINQSWGLRGSNSADPVSVYRSHVNRLKRKGL